MPKSLLRETTICMQKKSSLAIAKLKAKRNRRKFGIPLPNFALREMLPYFHGIREVLLEFGYPLEVIRPPQFAPWLSCIGIPHLHRLLSPCNIPVVTSTKSTPSFQSPLHYNACPATMWPYYLATWTCIKVKSYKCR